MVPSAVRKPLRLLAAGAFFCALPGCTVVSVTAAAVGVAADVAVGTAKVVGKGVGKAYDAMSGDGGGSADNSGIGIKYRESDPNHPWKPPGPAQEP